MDADEYNNIINSIKDCSSSIYNYRHSVLGILDSISNVLRELRVYIDRTFSYAEGNKVNRIHESGQILTEEYTEDGIHVSAYVPRSLYGWLM